MVHSDGAIWGWARQVEGTVMGLAGQDSGTVMGSMEMGTKLMGPARGGVCSDGASGGKGVQ